MWNVQIVRYVCWNSLRVRAGSKMKSYIRRIISERAGQGLPLYGSRREQTLTQRRAVLKIIKLRPQLTVRKNKETGVNYVDEPLPQKSRVVSFSGHPASFRPPSARPRVLEHPNGHPVPENGQDIECRGGRRARTPSRLPFMPKKGGMGVAVREALSASLSRYTGIAAHRTETHPHTPT